MVWALCIRVQMCLHEWLREGSFLRSVEVLSSLWWGRDEGLVSASQLMALVSTAYSSKHGLTHNCSIPTSARLWDLKIFTQNLQLFPHQQVWEQQLAKVCWQRSTRHRHPAQHSSHGSRNGTENIFFILTPTETSQAYRNTGWAPPLKVFQARRHRAWSTLQ